MPRDGFGVYSKPIGTTAVSGTRVESSKYNATVDDLVADANAPRPVTAGGTGANTAANARTNLGLGTAATKNSGISAGNLPTIEETDARYAGRGDTYRNRIINPAMQVSQDRGSTAIDYTTAGGYSIDQWITFLSTTPGGTLRAQRAAVTTPKGSPFRLRHTVIVADATMAAGDLYAIAHPIEGQMVADAQFGTAQAKQVIFTTGVRSSIAGTFGVRLSNNAGRSWIGLIVIAAGEINTDLIRTLVIPGDVLGTWDKGTAMGMTISITLASGTASNGVLGWQAANLSTTASQTNFMATVGATFDVFDVGFYVDHQNTGVVPRWELPAFDDDLRACNRYYYRTVSDGTFTRFGQGQVISSVSAEYAVPLPAPMRVRPALGVSGSTAHLEAGSVLALSALVMGASQGYSANSPSALLTGTGTGFTAGRGVSLIANADATTALIFNARM